MYIRHSRAHRKIQYVMQHCAIFGCKKKTIFSSTFQAKYFFFVLVRCCLFVLCSPVLVLGIFVSVVFILLFGDIWLFGGASLFTTRFALCENIENLSWMVRGMCECNRHVMHVDVMFVAFSSTNSLTLFVHFERKNKNGTTTTTNKTSRLVPKTHQHTNRQTF